MDLNGKIYPFSDVLSPEILQVLKDYASKLNFVDNPSFVYHRVDKKNIVEPTVRNSNTVIVKSMDLLEFVETEILKVLEKRISDSSPNGAIGNVYIHPAGNDITFIQYKEGGFFDWHIDFEKIKVNSGRSGFKEMHLIFCVDAPEDGGELQIKKDSNILSLSEAKTSNGCVIFDKQLEHRGEVVKKGTKIIITVDVFVVNQFIADSKLSESDTNKMSEFISRKTTHFITDSSETFKQMATYINNQYPELLSNLVPFMQIKIYTDTRDITIDITAENTMNRIAVFSDGDDYVYTNGEVDLSPIQMKKDFNSDWNQYIEDRENFPYRLKKLEIKNLSKDFPYNLLAAFESFLPYENSYSLQKIPKIPILSELLTTLIPFGKLETHNGLPVELLGNCSWHKDIVGYTYHCNQEEYGEFSMDYRYGFVHKDSLIPHPKRYTQEQMSALNKRAEHITQLEIEEMEQYECRDGTPFCNLSILFVNYAIESSRDYELYEMGVNLYQKQKEALITELHQKGSISETFLTKINDEIKNDPIYPKLMDLSKRFESEMS